MSGQFRVVPAGVSLAAQRLSAVSGEPWADLVGPLHQAPAAVAGSETAAAAARLHAELVAVVLQLQDALAEMAVAAEATAGNYRDADERNGALLRQIGAVGSGSW